MTTELQQQDWFDWETGEWLIEPKILLSTPETASIIAAGPKMLAALKLLVTETRAYSSPECDECEIVGPILRAADEAIALADPNYKPDVSRPDN